MGVQLCIPVPIPSCRSLLTVSYAAACFVLFDFSNQNPLILRWVKSCFFLNTFSFGGYFLFSAFLSFRGKMNRFSLAPAAPERGQGSGMLLPYCRVFGVSSKQGGQRPGVPGCLHQEGDSLMSNKGSAHVLPWVFLAPPEFALRRASPAPRSWSLPSPNQAGNIPAAPSGLQRTPWLRLAAAAAQPRVPSIGVYRKRLCEEAPGAPARVSVSFQPWVPKGPSLPRIRCESKPEPWGLTTSPRAAVSQGSIARGVYKKRRGLPGGGRDPGWHRGFVPTLG